MTTKRVPPDFTQQLHIVRDFVRDGLHQTPVEIVCMALGFLARGWGDGSPITCCLWEAASKLAIGNPEAALKQMNNAIGILEVKL